MLNDARKKKKVCVLGDFSVGKTSLVRRYVLNEFSGDYIATVGVKIYQHQSQIEIDGGLRDINQSIWDIEGSKSGAQLVGNYIKGASGALIVGDLTRDDAVASMASHAEKFLTIMTGRPLLFALNKSDLVRAEQRADGAALTKEFGGQVIQTSALTGDEVTAAFHAMYRRIFEIGA